MASLSIPALAVAHVIPIGKTIDTVRYEGNNVYTDYLIDDSTYISAKDLTTNVATNGFGSVYIDDFTSNYVFRIYPLGDIFTPGDKNSGTLIDIADLRDNAIIELTYDMVFDIQFLKHSGASGTSELHFSTSAYACFYDKDGNPVGQDVENVKEFVILENPDGVIDDSMTLNPGTFRFTLSIPDDAVYMAPCYLMYIYPPDSHDPIYIKTLAATCDGFRICTVKNMMLEQNQKLDTIINGTPEMEQAAQNAQNQVQDQDEQVNQVEELEKEYLDDFNQSSEVLNDKITDFVDGTGFNQLTALVVPVMNWEHSAMIMLLIIAFVNMSVIMFGR